MKKGQKIVIGNWKMNPETPEEAREIFVSLKKIAKDLKKTEFVICIPFVYLSILSNVKGYKSNVKIGSQDLFWEEKGSFTGEISPGMIKNFGVSYAVIGHSERRALGESDEMVNKKIKAALANKITPVVCIGEKERDIEGKFFELLKHQIKSAFQKIKKSELSKIIIAYEPVWAIGKSEKEYMKGEDLHQTTIFIRKALADLYDKKEAWKPKIIYGGSVTSNNVEDVMKGEVDGILPGRASLDPKEMKEILKILES